LAERIREALAVPGRRGIRAIAKQFGVSPSAERGPRSGWNVAIRALTCCRGLGVVGVPLRDCATNTTSKLNPRVYEVR
jgi:hypothetical protein